MKLNKLKRGFTLVELIIVMVIVGVLATTVYMRNNDSTDEAKIVAIASIIESYNKSININNTTEKFYQEFKAELNTIDNGDEDYLIEMIELNKVGKFPKDKMYEPDALTIEIREAVIDGYKRVIYLHMETTNEQDNYIIQEAMSLIKAKDNDVIVKND